MFSWRKKKSASSGFDPSGKTPVVRGSICTGERVAGYRDTETGKFTEVRLIRSEADLDAFLDEYRFDRAALKREW